MRRDHIEVREGELGAAQVRQGNAGSQLESHPDAPGEGDIGRREDRAHHPLGRSAGQLPEAPRDIDVETDNLLPAIHADGTMVEGHLQP